MNDINDISAELKSMDNILADMPRNMPYAVPAGYFEKLVPELHETITSLNEADPVTNWGKALPYTVPAGYFEALTDTLVATATGAEITTGLPKQVPFSLPAGYFESLPEKMLVAAKDNKKAAKQIPLKPGYSFPPVRWAAAAVLLICISAGSYITFLAPDRSASPEKILASVPDNELQEYFQHTYRIDAAGIVSNNEINNIQVDNKDIIQYLNENGWDAVE